MQLTVMDLLGTFAALELMTSVPETDVVDCGVQRSCRIPVFSDFTVALCVGFPFASTWARVGEVVPSVMSD